MSQATSLLATFEVLKSIKLVFILLLCTLKTAHMLVLFRHINTHKDLWVWSSEPECCCYDLKVTIKFWLFLHYNGVELFYLFIFSLF